MSQTHPSADVTIRALMPDDKLSVGDLARRAFPATQATFVKPSEAGGFIAEANGEVAAASLVRVIRLPSGRRVGMIAWLMTDPDHRGLGLASRLVRASTDHLREIGCGAVVTDVEGYNTGSANIFHAEGFRRLSVWQQLSLWTPLDLFWLWIRTGLAVDPGHFLWVDEAPGGRGPSQWRARFGSITLNAAFAALALALGGGLFLGGGFTIPDPTHFAAIIIGVALLLAAREGSMRLAAGNAGGAFEFRAWEGGWGVTLAILAFFGSVLPLPGNVYPKGDGWRMRDHTVAFGRAATASALVVSVLVLAASALRTPETVMFLDRIAWTMVIVGKPLLLFDTVIAVAPFEGYNARHLRDYHKPTWLALGAVAIAVFLWG